jgi:hypothetical protein
MLGLFVLKLNCGAFVFGETVDVAAVVHPFAPVTTTVNTTVLPAVTCTVLLFPPLNILPPGGAVHTKLFPLPDAVAVSIAVCAGQASTTFEGFTLTPPGGVVFTNTCTVPVPIQPLFGFCTVTVYTAVLVGLTTTVGVVCPLTPGPFHV